MVKTLILGDIHISNKDAVLREAQVDCVATIFKTVKPDEVIQLGDFLDFRKPSPEALLAAKSIIDFWKEKANVVILRGNHCASTKADDGVTALSVFESEKVDIITQLEVDHDLRRVYIPHYENEKLITNALRKCPKDSLFSVTSVIMVVLIPLVILILTLTLIALGIILFWVTFTEKMRELLSVMERKNIF